MNNEYLTDTYDSKMIYQDPQYLLKVAKCERMSVYDTCQYLRDIQTQPFPFSTNRIWYNYYDDNNKQVDEMYQYAVEHGIRATSRKYNLVTASGAFNVNYLKGYFAYYGKDLNVFRKNRSKYVSKTQSKSINDYLSKHQINVLIDTLKHNIENRSLDDIYLYDVLCKTRFDSSIGIPPAVIRYLDKCHLLYRRRTVEEGTSQGEQQQYHDWVNQWRERVDHLIDHGYSANEIRQLNTTQSARYFPIDRYIKEYRKDYQSQKLISQRIYHKYGEKGLTNPAQASVVKQRERAMLKKNYQEKLENEIKIGKKQLLQLFDSEQQIKRMIRKYGLNSHDIGQLSRSRNDDIRFAFDHWFLKKYPKYRIEQTPYSKYVCRDLRRITSRHMKYSLLIKKLLTKMLQKHHFDMSKINLVKMNKSNSYRKELYYAYTVRELVRNDRAFSEFIKILHTKYQYSTNKIYESIYPKGTLRVKQRAYIDQIIRSLDYEQLLKASNYSNNQIKLLLNLANIDKQQLFKYSSANKFANDYIEYQQFDDSVINQALWKLCQFEFQEHNQSVFEQQVYTCLLDDLGLIENRDFMLHDRSIIRPRELDFVFPDKKIAIELNPTYTHNSTIGAVFSTNGNDPKEITYHQNKYFRTKKQGYSLISLFERDLIEPRWSQVIKPLLRHLLTLADSQQPAVKYEDISNKYSLKKLARKFLKVHSLHHLQTANKYVAVTNEQNQLIAVYTLVKTKTGYSINQLACDLSLNINYQYIFENLIKWLKDHYQRTIKLSLSNNYAEHRLITGGQLVDITRPNLTFVNLSDANDYYRRNILSGWSATSGVIAKDLGHSSTMSVKQVHRYINDKLSHQHDGKHGYLDVYDTGNSVYEF